MGISTNKQKILILVTIFVTFGLIFGYIKINLNSSEDEDMKYDWFSNKGGIKITDGNNETISKNPSICVNINGTIYVVWQDSRDINNQSQPVVFFGYVPYYNIYFSKSVDGGKNFSKNICINNFKENVTHISPNIAIDDFGNIFILWVEYDIKSTEIIDIDIFMTSSKDEGNSFSDPIQVDNDLISVANIVKKPSVEVDNDGVVHVVFEGYPIDVHNLTDNIRSDIFYTYLEKNTKKFTPLIRINDDYGSNNQQISSSLTVDDDFVYFVWRDGRDGESNHTYYFSKLNRESLLITQNIKIGGSISRIDSGPSIAINGDLMYIVWADDYNKTPLMLAKSMNRGESFNYPIQINDENVNRGCSNPIIQVTSNGTIYISWEAVNNTLGSTTPQGIFITSSFDDGKTFNKNIELGNYEIRSIGNVFSQDQQSMYVHNNILYFAYEDEGYGKTSVSFQKFVYNSPLKLAIFSKTIKFFKKGCWLNRK